MKAFISYSHKDNHYKERLQVHLTQMKRDGLIHEWTDQEIHAGSRLDNVIGTALLSSSLFLALLSPDYISSDYCYNKEFEEAQKMQESDQLIIVPIIVEPCDWKNTPFGKLKALPKDGKAISEWTNLNLAYLNVIDELRRLMQAANAASLGTEEIVEAGEKAIRNYKVKKYFSQVDKFSFKENSLEEIKKYFQLSIAELGFIENLQGRFTTEGKEFFSCLISNRANNKNSFLTVHISNETRMQMADLSYSFSEKVQTNSIHMDKIYNVVDNEYEQFWTKNSMGFNSTNQTNGLLTSKQVAEQIWNDFISQVGVSIE